MAIPPGVDIAIWKWIVGGITGLFLLIAKFLNGKIDSKVSKSVFKEFKEKDQQAHTHTHHQLDEIKVAQNRFEGKLDGKQDKD